MAALLRSTRNVYGEKRAITKRWPSGHVACPFCDGPFKPPARCGNPACDANPSVTLAVANERRERYALQFALEAERQRYTALRWLPRAVIDA